MIGVFGALAGVLAAHWLSARREQRARNIAANQEFRAAFKDAVLSLTAGATLNNEIAEAAHARHLSAIYDFTPYVPNDRRFAFSTAMIRYRLAYWQQEKLSGEQLLESIYQLLDFADENWGE